MLVSLPEYFLTVRASVPFSYALQIDTYCLYGIVMPHLFVLEESLYLILWVDVG